MLKINDFIEKRLQHMSFPKNFAKILRASVLQNADGQIIASLLKFTCKSCCFIFSNHTQNHLTLHQGYFKYENTVQLENMSSMQYTKMLWLHALSTRENWLA